MSLDRIGIRGIGCVSSLGLGVESLWTATLSGQTGIVDGLGRIPTEILTNLSEKYGESYSMPARLSFAAADEALAQAGWDKFDGLIMATTTGQISIWESPWFQYFKAGLSLEDLRIAMREQPLGLLNTAVQKHYSSEGPSLLLTSACSASTQALAVAAMWLREKKVRRCLVGGVEVLSQMTVEGFKSLQLLSNKPATPFSKDRSGINLSEAAAFICLELTEDPSLPHLSGYGFSTDAYHITSPHPEGRGVYQAMAMALRSAKLAPGDISYVHAHATGSPANDSAESIAIHNLFEGQSPVVSATKSVHGHALAASGALESVLCVKSLQEQIQLKTNGCVELDPALNVNTSLENKKMPVKNILKNTLGFGGNNASLIFSAGS